MTTLPDDFKVLDHLTMVAPLGLRFWDRVSGRAVTDGLVVTAYPLGQPDSRRRVQACVNPSGVFVFQHLPGLQRVEQGAGDENYWSSPPARRAFIVEVFDLQRRFQPFLLDADLPVHNLFEVECGVVQSPPLSVPATVPLFSSASRPLPGPMAVLRADLWDPLAGKDGQPAAWAMIRARLAGHPPVTGMADADGRLALLFPYPEPVDLLPESPLVTGTSLMQQEWTIELEAAYDRLEPAGFTQVGRIPLQELCAIVGQSPATLWTDASPAAPLTQTTLKYGQEIILRSQSTTDSTPPSVLLLTPAGSPP
jgi:hypothetical protein